MYCRSATDTPNARWARIVIFVGFPRTCVIICEKSDGLGHKNCSLNHYSVRLVGPTIKPLSQTDQTLGEFVLLRSSSAPLHDVHRQRHRIGIGPGQLNKQLGTNLITWPFTRMAPAPLRDLVTARVRRGPVPNHPTLTKDQRTCFFDHLLVTTDANPHQSASLLRRRAIYLLGFDTRASTTGWLRTEQLRAVSDAGRTDHVRSWMAVRSSATALACGGDRDPLRACLRHALAPTGWSRRISITGLTGWARSATSRSMTNSWAVSTHADGAAFDCLDTFWNVCVPAQDMPNSMSIRCGHSCSPIPRCSASMPI